ncbi:MAG: zinc-binding dehydrogenase, partial [Planctomycetes bacterium]|nr:zinc-binding dehydrogenase [Planctomycetota bacterium]
DTLINSQAEDVEKRVLNETDGKGANLVITACPSPDAQKIAPRLAAIHGKINFFGGLPKGKDNVSLNTNLFHYKELMVTGSHGCNTYHCKMALDLQASGNIDLKPLVTNKFPLDNIKEAFDTALTGKGLKTVILP